MENFSKDFKLIKELGIGGFGAVWMAKHKPTEKLVAVKLTKKKRTLQHEYFIYELIRIRDRSLFSEKPIPGILGHGKIDDLSWLAMDMLGPSIDGELSGIVASL